MFNRHADPGSPPKTKRRTRLLAVAGAAVAVAGVAPALNASAAGRATATRTAATRAAATRTAATHPTGAQGQPRAAATYTNAVTDGYSIDFPDPSLIKGKDGYWYAYGTGGPYDETGAGDSAKIARSSDLTHWQKVGPLFTAATLPSWAAPGTGFWASDIRYVNGKYLLYYVVPDTTVSTSTGDPGIGVATAPSPAGPWKDSGTPLLAPEPVGTGFNSVIDPAEFTDSNGHRYLYWGSYGSGIRVVPLSDDGMKVTGPATQVASTRFEGSYVIHRDGWYYMFASSANCCAGPTTGYTVFTGRSRSPLGPFLDKEGTSLNASRSGGTIVLAQNGNEFVGVGHNAIATDVSGQTWIVYHGVLRDHPYLDGSPGFTMRPMLIDRLDWIDGWPLARGGQGPSDTQQTAPVTTGLVAEDFTNGSTGLQSAAGTLTVEKTDPASDAGGFGRLAGATAVGAKKLPSDEHVEADVRTSSSAGVVARYRDRGNNVSATVDAAHQALRVTTTIHGVPITRSAALPADFDPTVWHNVALDVRGDSATASVTDGRLGDPYATVNVIAPRSLSGRQAGVVGTGDVDNLEAAALYTPHTSVAPPPRTGKLDKSASDEFGSGLNAGWTWKNEDKAATVTGGQLNWPTEDTDLSNPSSVATSGMLLRDPPSGNYTVETKLTIDTGTDTVRNFQQAGLVVYANDNELLRYDNVAAGTTRFMEFGKVTMSSGVRAWGGAIIGPPAATTWLRLAHTTDPKTGESDFRAGSSRDGKHWVWGAVWTMPAGSNPKIGLVSQGSSAATDAAVGKANAQFDYFRIYR